MRSNPSLQKSELLDAAWPYGVLNIHSTRASFIRYTFLIRWVTGKEILISETNLVFLDSEIAELEDPMQTPLVVFPCRGKEQAQSVVHEPMAIATRCTKIDLFNLPRRTKCFRSFPGKSYPFYGASLRSTGS